MSRGRIWAGAAVLGVGLLGSAMGVLGQSAAPVPQTLPTPGVPNQPVLGSGFTPAVPLAPLSPAAAALAPPVVDPAQQAADSQKALEVLESSITVSKDKADALRADIAAMNGDRAKQNAALIAAGQRVKLAEIEIGAMEDRLKALAAAEDEVHGRLDGADASISNMLAALQRISLNPPPALIVDPSDAVGSARSAILIAAIVPQLRAKADQVVADLKHLTDIHTEAQAEQDQLKANFAVLQEEQLRIATLIQAKKQGIDSANTQLSTEEQQAADLGAKATSLKSLIASLSSQLTVVSDAAKAPSSANPQLPSATPDAIRAALADTSRIAPAIPFPTARGYLTIPVNGTNVEDYGANDGLGGIARGISYTTPANAQVVAPADGWVMYKGPYLNYGQIVILNPGQNYTIVLAGLDAVSVDIGQFVLEGEPLGKMGSRTIGRTMATSAGVSEPTLYIELRKNDQPVDPTGWWASPANPTQSG